MGISNPQARHVEAKPKWQVHVNCLAKPQPTLNAIGLANVTELFIISEIACIYYCARRARGRLGLCDHRG